MSCLTLWWCSATHPDFVNTYMRYIAFLLESLYCTRSLSSAIIRDKRLISNNLSFFPLLMDNYDQKPNCWHCIKPSRVIFARFFRLLYANGLPSLKVEQKVWNVKLIIKVFRFQYVFFFFFFFFMIISWSYFFHFITWHVHVSEHILSIHFNAFVSKSTILLRPFTLSFLY